MSKFEKVQAHLGEIVRGTVEETLNSLLDAEVGNNDETVIVEQHSSPSNPNSLCALVVLCDSPAFTKVCVLGSFAVLNPAPGRDCTMAVEKTSWSEVKGLYN